MTQDFCPEQEKEEITMEMQRLWKEQTWKGKIGGPFDFEMPVLTSKWR